MLFDTDVLIRLLHISTKAAKEEDAGRNRRAGAPTRAINALPSKFFSLPPIVEAHCKVSKHYPPHSSPFSLLWKPTAKCPSTTLYILLPTQGTRGGIAARARPRAPSTHCPPLFSLLWKPTAKCPSTTLYILLPTPYFSPFVVPIHPCHRLRHIKGTTPVSSQFPPPSICNTRTPPGMTHPAARRRSIEGANQRNPVGLFLSIPHKRGGVGPGNNDAKKDLFLPMSAFYDSMPRSNGVVGGCIHTWFVIDRDNPDSASCRILLGFLQGS